MFCAKVIAAAAQKRRVAAAQVVVKRGLGQFIVPVRFAGHGGGDALMMDYVCELIAAGGAEGLTSVDASVESHVMALAAEHSRTHGGSAVELAEFTEK